MIHNVCVSCSLLMMRQRDSSGIEQAAEYLQRALTTADVNTALLLAPIDECIGDAMQRHRWLVDVDASHHSMRHSM